MAADIAVAKSGAAPVMPLTFVIGRPSKLPTHTPTVTSRVKPTVQLSRYPFEVPVLAATSNGRSSAELSPNAATRALLSRSMSASIAAIGSGITRRSSAAAGAGRLTSAAARTARSGR